MAFNIVAQLQLQAPANLQNVVSDIQRKLSGITVPINVSISPNTTAVLNALQNQLNAITSSLSSVAAQAPNAAAAMNAVGTSVTRASTASGGADAAFKSLVSQIKATTNASNEASSAVDNFGKQAGLAARRYSAFLLAGGSIVTFINSLRTGIQDAIAFEREMNKIQQISSESATSIAGLERDINRLSTTLGVSASDLAKTTLSLKQLGLSIEDTKTVLDTLAKTELAPTFGEIADTTQGVIAAMSQFKLQASDVDKTLGGINEVSKAFALQSGDIVTAIRLMGSEFHAAGGNINELIALFTAVKSTSQESAESIATSLRTILVRLERSNTIENLHQLGIELTYTRGEAERLGRTDLTGQFVGPYEAVLRLSAALKELRSTDPRFAAISEELGGYRQIEKLVPLLQETAKAQTAYNLAQRGSGSLSESVAKSQESLAVQIGKVRQEFDELIRTVTNSQSFKTMVTVALDLASALISIAKAMTPLLPLLTALAALKLGQNIGSLARGLGGGLFGGSASPVGTLGAVAGKGFASGGVVPGTGDSDTHFAHLTPGEYVIRKQAAKAIGYDKLERMNRYAAGGIVRRFVDGGDEDERFYLFPEQKGKPRLSATAGNIDILQSALGAQATAYQGSGPAKDAAAISYKLPRQSYEQQVRRREEARKEFAAQLQTGYEDIGITGNTIRVPYTNDRLGIISRDAANLAGKNIIINSDISKLRDLNPSIREGLQSRGVKNVSGSIDRYILSAEQNKIFSQDVSKKVSLAINNAFQEHFKDATHDFTPNPAAVSSINGYLVEQYIGGIAQTLPRGGTTAFDFIGNGLINSKNLNNVVYPRPIEANLIESKNTAANEQSYTVLAKYLNFMGAASSYDKQGKFDYDVGGAGDERLLQKFASGGMVRITPGAVGVVALNAAKDETLHISTTSDKVKEKLAKIFPNKDYEGLYGDVEVAQAPKDLRDSVNRQAHIGMREVIQNVVNDMFAGGKIKRHKVTRAEQDTIYDNYGGKSFAGAIFEGVLAVTSKKLDDKGGNEANFDFKDVSTTDFERLAKFSTYKEYVDAKSTISRANIANKILNEGTLDKGLFDTTNIASAPVKKNSGGGITDSVPSLLTPGEYVINRQAAARIGKANLDKMNAGGVAHFAEGGVVQHFAIGGFNEADEETKRKVAEARRIRLAAQEEKRQNSLRSIPDLPKEYEEFAAVEAAGQEKDIRYASSYGTSEGYNPQGDLKRRRQAALALPISPAAQAALARQTGPDLARGYVGAGDALSNTTISSLLQPDHNYNIEKSIRGRLGGDPSKYSEQTIRQTAAEEINKYQKQLIQQNLRELTVGKDVANETEKRLKATELARKTMEQIQQSEQQLASSTKQTAAESQKIAQAEAENLSLVQKGFASIEAGGEGPAPRSWRELLSAKKNPLLGAALFTGGAYTASYLQEASGTAEQAVNAGTETSFGTKRAVAGAITGAITGAGIGLQFGNAPGAAIGAAAGALIGLASAAHQASQELADIKADRNARNAAYAVSQYQKNLSPNLSGLDAAYVQAQAAFTEQTTDPKSILSAVGNSRIQRNFITGNYFGSNSNFTNPFNPLGALDKLVGYSKEQEGREDIEAAKTNYGTLLPQLELGAQVSGSRAVRTQSLDLTNLDINDPAQAAAIANKVTNSGININQQIERISQAREAVYGKGSAGSSIVEVTKEVTASIKSEWTHMMADISHGSVAPLVEAFHNLHASLATTSVAMQTLSEKTSLSTNLISGQVFGAKIPNYGLGLAGYGAADTTTFNQAVGKVTAPLGTDLGGQLANDLTTGNAVRQALIQALPQYLASGRLSTDTNSTVFASSIEDILKRQGIDTAQGSAASLEIENIKRNLGAEVTTTGGGGRNVPDFTTKALADVGAEINKLTAGGRGTAALAETQSITQELQKNLQQFADAALASAQHLQIFGAALDKASQLAVQATRVRAEVTGIQEHREATSILDIPLSELQRGFTDKQSRLAGLTGLSFAQTQQPDIIGGQLNSVATQIRAKQEEISNNPGDLQNSQKLVQEFTNLTSVSSNLHQILENNVAAYTEESTAIKERINLYKQEQQSKLSIAERYLTGTTEDRVKIRRGEQYFNIANQQGNLAGFAQGGEQIKELFEFARSAGPQRIPGTNQTYSDRLNELNIRTGQLGGLPGSATITKGDEGIVNALASQLTPIAELAKNSQEILAQYVGTQGVTELAKDATTANTTAIDNLTIAINNFKDTQVAIEGIRQALITARQAANPPVTQAGGGPIARGTDTVPAMLTPGEHIINYRSAVANRGLLNYINNANGPVDVTYRAGGGDIPGIENLRRAYNTGRALRLPTRTTYAATRPRVAVDPIAALAQGLQGIELGERGIAQNAAGIIDLEKNIHIGRHRPGEEEQFSAYNAIAGTHIRYFEERAQDLGGATQALNLYRARSGLAAGSYPLAIGHFGGANVSAPTAIAQSPEVTRNILLNRLSRTGGRLPQPSAAPQDTTRINVAHQAPHVTNKSTADYAYEQYLIQHPVQPYAAVNNIPVSVPSQPQLSAEEKRKKYLADRELARQYNEEKYGESWWSKFKSSADSFFGPARNFASGGVVGGPDDRLIAASSGEYVMNRNAVNRIGVDNLQRFNNGGVVGFADGGAVRGNNENANPSANYQALISAFAGFNSTVTTLVGALAKIPSSIQLSGNHTVAVSITGGEALKSLEAGMQKLIDNAVNTGINNLIKQRFPEVGRLDSTEQQPKALPSTK